MTFTSKAKSRHAAIAQAACLSIIALIGLGGSELGAQEREFGLQDTSTGGYVFAPYGRFNLAYQGFDDGQERTSNVVDVNTSSGRLGFFLRDADDPMGFSFQFETGIGFRPSQNTSQVNTPDAFNWTRRNLRQVQLIYTGSFGVIRAGQGSQATDAIAEIDLGKATIFAKSNISEMLGDYLLRAKDGELVYEIGSTYGNFDGSRRFRLRYDTPEFAGFSFAVSYGQEVLREGDDNTYYDYALRYGTDIGRVALSAGIGQNFVDTDSETVRATTGSASILDPETGLNLTLAAGQSNEGPKPSYYWIKAGWNADFFAFGPTKFVVEGFRGQDYETAGSTSDMWGVAVAQMIERYNLEFFVAWREFSFTERDRDFEVAEHVLAGAEIKF